MARQDLKALFDSVREIAASEENRQKEWLWAPESTDAKDHWRGTPQPYGQIHAAPFTVEPEFPLWAKIIGFDMVDFYTDPDCYLENTLKIAIYRHRHFKECTPAGKTIGIWLGATLESTLFGAQDHLSLRRLALAGPRAGHPRRERPGGDAAARLLQAAD